MIAQQELDSLGQPRRYCQSTTLGEFMDKCSSSEQMRSAKDKVILDAFASAGPASQRQCTIRPEAGKCRARTYPQARARQGGLRNRVTPQAGGGSLINNLPSIIC